MPVIGKSLTEEVTGSRRTAWPPVEPEHDRILLGVVPAGLEPEEEMLAVRDVEIARKLLHRRIAKFGLDNAELVLR